MLPFQIGRIIFAVAQFREVVPSCQLRASLYCEQQSSHANARKSRMGLTLFDNCRASVSDSENGRIPAQWKDLLRCRRCGLYGRRQRRARPSALSRYSIEQTTALSSRLAQTMRELTKGN